MKKAEAYAKKWGIEKVFGGKGAYQGLFAVFALLYRCWFRMVFIVIFVCIELLDDPEVVAVYNPVSISSSSRRPYCRSGTSFAYAWT